jgi:hypothetical protein
MQKAPRLLPQEELASQVLGVLHWSLLVQELKHAVPLQTYGVQARESGAAHCPLALQVEGGV